MTFLRHFSRANARRFVAVVRQRGWRAAWDTSRTYLERAGVLHRRGVVPGQHYLSRFWRDIARQDAFHVRQPPAVLRGRRRIAMIGDINLPQCRKYRVEQLSELWEACGVDYGFAHHEDVPRAIGLLQEATHCMIYRGLNTPLFTQYFYEARRLRVPVLYDIDDPLFSVSAYETYANMKALPETTKAHFLNEAPKYHDTMNQADIVTVSTPGLAEHARLYTSRPVHVRRNFADRATLAAADRARAETSCDRGAQFRLAFASGSMGHEIDLTTIGNDLAGFFTADPARRLLILGHFDRRLLPEGLAAQTEIRAFEDYNGYLRKLAAADCAVMPLTDDIFNRCKSAVRVLDAAAVAVPSLVSQVGDLAAVVRDGETGRVLERGESWRDALEALAGDRAACAAMGRAARADIDARWTVRTGPPVVEQAVLDWILQ